MGKEVKQIEMNALKTTFKDVRDIVLLTAGGIDCRTDNQMRLALRQKKIRMQVVKNSMAQRIFNELGMTSTSFWEGVTILAWGAGSLAELSRELETWIRKIDKLKAKGAFAEGQEIDFAQALKMPTRAEAVGRVVSLAQAPASRLIGQILAPAGRIAGQIKTLEEKIEAAPAAETPAAPAAETPAAPAAETPAAPAAS